MFMFLNLGLRRIVWSRLCPAAFASPNASQVPIGTGWVQCGQGYAQLPFLPLTRVRYPSGLGGLKDVLQPLFRTEIQTRELRASSRALHHSTTPSGPLINILVLIIKIFFKRLFKNTQGLNAIFKCVYGCYFNISLLV